MIRYVVAVLLTTAVVGVGFTAIEEASAVRGETQLDGEIAAIERAAVSLLEHDDPTPGDATRARRVVDLDLPSDGFASSGVDTLVFEPRTGTNRTVVRYQIAGRAEKRLLLDAVLVSATAGERALDLSGRDGSLTLVLALVLDGSRTPVVQVTVRE